jgi:hypothetical protein
VLGGITTLARRDELAGDLYQLCRLAAIRLPVRFASAARAFAEQTSAANPHQRGLAAFEGLAGLLEYRSDMTAEITAQATDPPDEPPEMS